VSDAWRTYSNAPEEGTLVCPANEVPARGARCITVSSSNGDFPLLLVRDGTGVRGFVNACPHQYLPLNYRSDAVLSADGRRLLCSAHGAAFDSVTGACLSGEAADGLDPVPLTEDAQGNLRIRR